jgi:hypothetical protein
MFVAGFFLMDFFYRITNLHPAPWLAQLIDSFVGLILLFLATYVSLSIARAWGWVPERNVFKPIIEALERIAAGDFSIRVENKYQDNEWSVSWPPGSTRLLQSWIKWRTCARSSFPMSRMRSNPRSRPSTASPGRWKTTG